MPSFVITLAIGALVAVTRAAPTKSSIPPPPATESVEVTELPLPPVAENRTGFCTQSINPNGTGCISIPLGDFQAGDFTPDGNHVIVNVQFVGAPAAPDPANIYDGEQVILVKADGTKFPNGDSWKCLSCGVPAANAQSLHPERDYPHVFRSGTKALWGHNVLDCGAKLESEDCTPNNTYIYPIYWPNTADGSGKGGSPRELRLHPDDTHIGFSSFTSSGGQLSFFARLNLNSAPLTGIPRVPRYELVHVNILYNPILSERFTASGSKLLFDQNHGSIGELRGFSGTGDAVAYIGAGLEANNVDIFTRHLSTGASRRITSHPEYVDPVASSADNKWVIIMDTRGSGRLMFAAGMRGIPPLADFITAAAQAATRNNGKRRFFQPILLDGYGDRDSYFGQRLNPHDDEEGSIGDPNWNGRADPAFSLDGTKIVYWQAIVVSPACGGSNPIPCPVSTAQGGREYRLMLAKLPSRRPISPAPVFDVGDRIAWAIPYSPGDAYPSPKGLKSGNYTLKGKVSGKADVYLQLGDSSGVSRIVANYTNYCDDGVHYVNGYEDISNTNDPQNHWKNHIDWYSDLVGTGGANASKKTTEGGFHLDIEVLVNDFQATGKLITTVDGVSYEPPANGT